jgi:putative ABC transport system permease protein
MQKRLKMKKKLNVFSGINLVGNVKIALRALRSNMLRSSLTVLGIVIGVAAVVALLSIGKGATANITDRVASMGSNLITISTQMRFGPGGSSSDSSSLLYSDYEQISSTISGIRSVVPVYSGQEQISSSTRSSRYSITGVTADYLDVRSYTIGQGRFISEEDIASDKQVVVLGSQVADDIFDGLSPLGRKLTINGKEFTVVGVFEESGSSTGMSSGDDVVLIPLSTAYDKIFGTTAMSNGQRTVSSILISASSSDVVDQVISDVELLLRSNHKLTLTETLPFSVSSQAQALETLSTVSSTLTAFLGAIAAISLIVGGIGIMNIELVSVTERTREIGLRKAVGATQRVILTQFLIETMTLAVMGGVLGILLGSAIAETFTLLGVITAKITADTLLLAFFSAAIIGLFFGIYPAYQASKLRPIVALRYE